VRERLILILESIELILEPFAPKGEFVDLPLNGGGVLLLTCTLLARLTVFGKFSVVLRFPAEFLGVV
jgi:hypothetical protein